MTSKDFRQLSVDFRTLPKPSKCWAFTRLHSRGKAFGKTFRIIRFDRRKCGKVVEIDLHKNLGVKFTCFFLALCLTELC